MVFEDKMGGNFTIVDLSSAFVLLAEGKVCSEGGGVLGSAL
jgi:hypothetical protein